ncbi:unnamed protein product [Cyclocybe aegerita]|uniref:Uncharacterized protein n=1 Tax=Cyclocybe aegerita TaxID=1973307 RepID=A0A8S0WMG7_CYCAE|nr:unnamed protein product [Cyclocybe aegerita]
MGQSCCCEHPPVVPCDTDNSSGLAASQLRLLHSTSLDEPDSHAHSIARCLHNLAPSRTPRRPGDLNAIRRRLLALYDTVINSPDFYASRPWTIVHLEPFDREAYIAALESQHPAIPSEFRLFILEWPERAAIRSIWPGLPLLNCKTNNIQRARGTNFIARRPPLLSGLLFKDGYPGVEFVPALLFWTHDRSRTTWLLCDERPDLFLFGRVFTLYYPIEADVIPYHDYGDGDETNYQVLESALAYGDFAVEDWIAYLEKEWRRPSGVHPILAPPFHVVQPHDDVAVDLENEIFVDTAECKGNNAKAGIGSFKINAAPGLRKVHLLLARAAGQEADTAIPPTQDVEAPEEFVHW